MELRVPDIHRMHAGSTALEQAIGEAAGGGSDIDTDKTGGIDGKMIQRRFKFEAAPANILFAHGEADVRIRRNRSSRFGDELAFDVNLPGHDGAGGLIQRLEKAAFDECCIEPFFARCHSDCR